MEYSTGFILISESSLEDRGCSVQYKLHAVVHMHYRITIYSIRYLRIFV